MPRTYDWHELREEGDWVKNPGTRVNQTARLAKLYVARHLPEGSQVVTVTTPEGTVTFLAYVPPRAEDPAPQPVTVEPRPESPRQTTATKRREDREAKERELQVKGRQLLNSSYTKIGEETAGYDDYVRPTGGPTPDDLIERELSALRREGASLDEVENRREELEKKYKPKTKGPVDENYDDIWN